MLGRGCGAACARRRRRAAGDDHGQLAAALRHQPSPPTCSARGFALVAALRGLAAAASIRVRDIGATGRRYGFYPFLLLLMAGVSGAFLTGDLFNLYVWFEVLLIASFGLLVLGARTRAARRRGEIRLPQSRRDDAVPDRHRPTLRRLRHAQHGRHRAQGRDLLPATAPLMTIWRRCSCSPSA